MLSSQCGRKASLAPSRRINPTPLTLGAAAYLLLFLPVVIAGRWVERRFHVR